MTEHLPECPLLNPCCDDKEEPEHGFCLGDLARCLHCMAECICERLRACEERVSCECLTPAALALTGMGDPRYAKGYAAGLDAAQEAGFLEGLDWFPQEITRQKAGTSGTTLSILCAVHSYAEALIREYKDGLLLPARTDGIISQDMRMATNLSMGKATAGSLAEFLKASPPDCPVTLSPDGIFLVVLNPPA